IGSVDWYPPTAAPLQALSGFWVFKESLGVVRLRGLDVDPFAALADASQVSDAEFALATFQRFVDRISLCLTSLIGSGLGSIPWSSSAWAHGDRHRHDPARGQWRSRRQRNLWGL